jgi:protein-L-isoaspartate(D-aspartate) O-methyltransferase
MPPLTPRALSRLLATLVAIAPLSDAAPAAPADADRAAERAAMLRTVRAHAARVGGIDPTVLEAMARVPRHRFVPDAQAEHAYEDRPLPIGDGQTISQPFIVAYMTHLMQVRRGARVLEVGTGSGYQAAVLAELGCEVRSIEIVRALGERAARSLAALGLPVTVRIGDGYLGWPEAAPFDAIIVTAGTHQVPPPLLEQLAVGGRLVLPLADDTGTEMLTVLTRQADGRYAQEQKIPVLFVPLTRGGPR